MVVVLASSPGHTHLSMLHIERWVWPGDEAIVVSRRLLLDLNLVLQRTVDKISCFIIVQSEDDY